MLVVGCATGIRAAACQRGLAACPAGYRQLVTYSATKVAAMALDDASFLTGQVFTPDGGETLL